LERTQILFGKLPAQVSRTKSGDKLFDIFKSILFTNYLTTGKSVIPV